MFGRNKSSKECRTRDCSGKTNSNVEAGSDMNRKSSSSKHAKTSKSSKRSSSRS